MNETVFFIWIFGAIWTGHAAAQATHWERPIEVTMFVLASLLWPAFWLFVGIMALVGKLK